MIRGIPVFQQAAVCLTKFGPESGETAKEILARKDLERRSGVGGHKKMGLVGRWGKGYRANHTNFNFAARRQHRSICRDQRSEATEHGLRQLTRLYGGNTACSAATYSKTYRNTC